MILQFGNVWITKTSVRHVRALSDFMQTQLLKCFQFHDKRLFKITENYLNLSYKVQRVWLYIWGSVKADTYEMKDADI